MRCLLLPVLLLAACVEVSAVGRSLRSNAHGNSATNDMSQAPDLAEMEAEEEQDEGQEQEADAQQPPPSAPVQMVARTPAGAPLQEGRGPSPAVAAPSPQISPAENADVEGSARRAELGLTALSAVPPTLPSISLPSFDKALEALTTPFPLTVPGMSSPLSYDDAALSAKALFPPAAVSSPSRAKPATSFHGARKPDFQAIPKKSVDCHPPCISDRGVCNDNMCFCKSPYTGTTCQHKLADHGRASYAMVVAFSVTCVVFGFLFAQICHGLIVHHFEKRLTWLGDGFQRKEVWNPPSHKAKGGGAAPA